MIPPGGTLGILGGGQLGRMLALAAAPLGIRIHVFAPEAECPAADVSFAHTRAAFDDAAALDRFAAAVDVVTVEWENVPVAALERLAWHVPVRPGAAALAVAQDRLSEKRFALAEGAATAPFAAVETRADLTAAMRAVGLPAILKTRRFGYDGRGQVRLDRADQADAAWAAVGGAPCILEGRIAFVAEFSVILARGEDGGLIVWDAAENSHADGVLSVSRAPAVAPPLSQVFTAVAISRRIAERLGYVGVLATEWFSCETGPVFNEMAPRVHNSGHWTIEGANTSQFEAAVRAACGWPLGDPSLRGAGWEMRNILGGAVVAWPDLAREAGAHLHLYGKADAAAGRKMGHVTRALPDAR